MSEEWCKHKVINWEEPDPSVGIFGYAVWCESCGAEAVDFEEEYDADEDYSGRLVGFNVKEWRMPE